MSNLLKKPKPDKAGTNKISSSDDESFLVLLSEVSLFTEIKADPQALEVIASIMERKNFEKGEKILTEGEHGAEMFILISGEASVFKSTPDGENYKVTILTGEKRPFMGEGALLESDARSATIQAETHCECLLLHRKNFISFCQQYPQWALPIVLRIARVVLGRVHKMNGDFMLLYRALVAEIRGHT